METATSSLSSENERKAEILRQIEFLKAQLNGNTTSCSKVVEEDDAEDERGDEDDELAVVVHAYAVPHPGTVVV